MNAIMHVDGACKGNPGNMGIGVVIDVTEDTDKSQELSYSIGSGTNNIAEYFALIVGLRVAFSIGIAKIKVNSDSLLLVNQVNDKWKIKDDKLKTLCMIVKRLIKKFDSVEVTWIPREDNKSADKLSSKGAQKKSIDKIKIAAFSGS